MTKTPGWKCGCDEGKSPRWECDCPDCEEFVPEEMARRLANVEQLLEALRGMLLAYEGDAGDTDSPACIAARAAVEKAGGKQ